VIQTHARKAQASENQGRWNDRIWRKRVLIGMSEGHQKKIHRLFWAPEETSINRHVRWTSPDKNRLFWAPEETPINRHVRRTSEERQYFLWAPEETALNRYVRWTSPDKTDCFGLRRRLLLIGMSDGHHQIKPIVLASGGDSY